MPEYLAPGVYVEEVSYRSKTIEGVGTAVAGFVGPTRFGPTRGKPELLTSFADFERIYGGLDQLNFTDDSEPSHNFIAHAVRAFFEEGGSRLYVSRVYKASEGDAATSLASPADDPSPGSPDGETATQAGFASTEISSGTDAITLNARYPGSGGNVSVVITVWVGNNLLPSAPDLKGLSDRDIVWVKGTSETPTLYWVQRAFDSSTGKMEWFFKDDEDDENDSDDATTMPPKLDAIVDVTDANHRLRVIRLSVEITFPGKYPRVEQWDDVRIHPDHRQSLTKLFGASLQTRMQELTVPLIISTAGLRATQIAQALLDQKNLEPGPRRSDADEPPSDADAPSSDEDSRPSIMSQINDTLAPAQRQIRVQLKNGSDGGRPSANDYKGSESDDPDKASGLESLEAVHEITMVAAPGSTYFYDQGEGKSTQAILGYLISHCERMRYRIAVLDSPAGQSVGGIRDFRARFDSKHAALYYPWIRIMDPISETEISVPPSGQMCGIYARNDVEHGVHKAPANEVIRTAIGLEYVLNKAHQDVLNPAGINCLRFFRGRGFRVWGARTITSDPEWKYVNLRRYFAFLEYSIELGTQWAVFENNGPALWTNVRRTIEDFLYNEWQSGHLLGESPETSYFVRCDRTTMTQNDLDNGRMICLVGVAPLRPAEFVIFRIGQWTADANR